MNAPLNSDSQFPSALETGTATAPSSYSPSVPISVYRELATELKTTQTTLDALTQQNQQLLRQNKLLRTEIQRFVKSAEQLGHFAGVMPPSAAAPASEASATGDSSDAALPDLFSQAASPEAQPEPPWAESPADGAASTIASMGADAAFPAAAAQGTPRSTPPKGPSALVHRPKAKKRDRLHTHDPESGKQRLFTEQSEGVRPLSKVASRSDMGNLWLATTILLVVVSAFGAGFLIMRPLLNR